MLLQMLRAVSKMLDIKIEVGEGADNIAAAESHIYCSKSIIDELIKFYETDENPKQVFTEKKSFETKAAVVPKASREPLPEVETRSDIVEWFITVDENKGLLIKDFPLDGKLEVDGKIVTYAVAKGRPFKKVRLI